jgi:hypothetical protein
MGMKTNLQNALGLSPKDKTGLREALGICTKDKTGLREASGYSPKGKISRKADFLGQQRQEQ